MRKIRKLLLVAILATLLVATLVLAACNLTFGGGWGTVFTPQTAYAEAQELGYTGTLEEFMESITGEDGTDGVGIKSVELNSEGHLLVTLTDNNIIDCGSVKGEQGPKGDTGADGVTPQLKVGADDLWYISYDNGSTWTCLNAKATGSDGAQGPKGDTGATGAQGSKGDTGATGAKGDKGDDGVSITSTSFDKDGNTVISYSDGTTQKIEHNWTEFEVIQKVSCTTDGNAIYYCADCGLMRLVIFEKLGHDIVQHEAKAATCTSVGWNAYETCNRCDYSTKVEIPKTSHNFVDGECSVCGAADIEEATDLEYELSDDETYYIVTGIGSETRTRFAIPAEYNGKPVKEIGEDAFRANDVDEIIGATEVVVSEGITDIAEYAFGTCLNLMSVTLPSTLVNMDPMAFYGCYKLVEVINKSNLEINAECWDYESADDIKVKVPKVVKKEGKTDIVRSEDYIFFTTNGTKYLLGYEGNATDLILPENYGSLTYEIWPMAFAYNVNIKSVEISDGVAAIVDYAFCYCSSLTSIEIPTSVTSIGYGAFGWCSSLTSIEIPSSVTSIGNYAFYGCGSLTSIEIPSSVTSIGNYAFVDCSSLTSIEIPTSVTSIGNYAFAGCSSLTSIEIPTSVTSIGNYAFADCSSSLESITVADGNTIYHSDGNCLIETATKALILGCKNSVIPTDTSVTAIGDYAFYNCSSLASIEIPTSVTAIGDYAFYNCSSLASIEIPTSVTAIGDYAFSSCGNLASVRFGENSQLASIGYGAFGWCSSLTSIEIPTSVTSIGDWAFYYCSSLTSIEIPTSVTSIGDYAFSVCGNLASVRFGENSQLGGIGGSAFQYCASLTSIEIPSSVMSIGYCAFEQCSSLTSVTFDENSQLEWIGGHAFQHCASLTSIEIPSSVMSIGEWTFGGCSSLTSVTFGENSQLASIGDDVFFSCSSLTSIEIPSGVTSIGYEAFYDCINLTSVVIPSSVTSIGIYAFSNCGSLTIYCEAESQPDGWDYFWNDFDCPVVWGYVAEE